MTSYFNILLLLSIQIALFIAFNIMNQVEWWMSLLLLTPLIVTGIHFLMKRFLGYGLVFLEGGTTATHMNYVNTGNFNATKTNVAQMNNAANKFNNALQNVNTAANNMTNAANMR